MNLLEYSDTLTETDVKRHIAHPFAVPANCRQLSIRLAFAPAEMDGTRNLLTLTLFDPAGFRGAGHRGGNEHIVEIDAQHATPGYFAGALPAGTWTVQLDTHMVLPGEPCRYEVSVSAGIDDNEEAPQQREEAHASPRFAHVANPNPSWYRGDLHAHTVHSDASWQVADLVAAARAKQLDFIALTDHNTVSPLAEMESYSTDDLLTMGGQELTTFWGHAVCLGSHEWIDWRVTRDGDEMAAIASQRYAGEEIFIIAHPASVGDPYCTGCRWVYPGMMPGSARFVEVWNGPWVGSHEQNRDKNVDGLALYYRWLNEGHRLVATAGSDVHGPTGYERGPGFNTVYADELSERGILNALAAGHLYLSSGPKLAFNAQNQIGAQAMMGDTLAVFEHARSVSLAASWEGDLRDAVARLIVDGETLEEIGIREEGTISWTLSTQGIDWCSVELRTTGGELLALSNPIFFELDQT